MSAIENADRVESAEEAKEREGESELVPGPDHNHGRDRDDPASRSGDVEVNGAGVNRDGEAASHDDEVGESPCERHICHARP